MKVWYNTDEMYPVYIFERKDPTWCTQTDLPEELVKRYIAAQKEFGKVLDEVKIALGDQD